MHTKTIKELSALLQGKQVSATELARHLLARAQASDLNAYTDINEELTLAQAAAADARLAGGDTTPLTGVPIAHKDIFVTRGWRSTAGSRMLENYVSPFDATVVEQLAAAGTVTLGKLNCDEFAMGSSNENSYFGPVKTRGTAARCRAARPAAPRRPWLPALRPALQPPTPAARSASRPHSAA